MEEEVFEAREELKRIEHIVFVSLKYTRTTDVLRNGLLRFVSFYDILVNGYLLHAEEKGLIEKIPKSPALAVKQLMKLYPDDAKLQQYLGLYFFVKGLLKKPYDKINEYRRHVGMLFHLSEENGYEYNRTVAINIDSLEATEWYLNNFFSFSLKFLDLAKEEDY